MVVPPGRRSLLVALGQLGSFGAALTAVVIVLLPADVDAPLWSLVMYALVGPTYLAAGLVAWWRRPSGRVGALLCLCGAAFLASATGNVTVPALAAVGIALGELPIGVMIHLLLAFPTGRLPDRWSRGLVVAGYLVTVVLCAPQYLAERPALFRTVSSAAGFVVIALAAVVLARRLRAADAAQRRVLAAVSGYGVFAILFLTLSAIVTRIAGLDPVGLFVAQMFVVVGLPFAFLAGVVRGGFARTADVEELGVWLGTADGARPALRDALAATLGDPSLELLFWLPEDGRYVDAVGAPRVLQRGHPAATQSEQGAPAAVPGRAHVTVHFGGERVGAIVYDAVALPDRLTPRQGEVLALIAEGRTNAAIARRLAITEKAVVQHASRIYDLLGLSAGGEDHRRVRAVVRYLSR